MPRTAGCFMPNRTISPISSWFTPFSMAGTKTTSSLAWASRSRAFSLRSRRSLPRIDSWVCLGREAVELEVNRGADVGQAGQEAVVPGNAYAVGVEHYDGDALVECHPQHWQDFRVDGGLAPAELDYLRLAFQLDEPVQHPLDLFHRQAEPRLGVGEADGAVQVAVAVDLDKSQAGVLLVLGAQPAVLGTAVDHLGAEFQGDRAGLVVAQRTEVHFGVGAYQGLEPSVVRAPLPHDDPAILDQYLGVDGLQTPGADAPGQLVENVVRVLLLGPAPGRHRLPLSPSSFRYCSCVVHASFMISHEI